MLFWCEVTQSDAACSSEFLWPSTPPYSCTRSCNLSPNRCMWALSTLHSYQVCVPHVTLRTDLILTNQSRAATAVAAAAAAAVEITLSAGSKMLHCCTSACFISSPLDCVCRAATDETFLMGMREKQGKKLDRGGRNEKWFSGHFIG